MNKKTSFCRIILFAAGLSALIYGLYQGGAGEVLKRAARICLEGIGIG